MTRFDAIVVGGGISGCATAWNLARRGARVALLEQGEIAREQSRWAWGFVRRQGRDAAEVPLAKLAAEIWPGLAGQLQADLQYVRDGILSIAETADDAARLTEAAALAADHGVDSRLVGPDEIRDLAPGLAGDWRLGLLTPEDGHAEPIAATRAFAAAASRLGAEIRTGVAVNDLLIENGVATGVATADGPLAASVVIVTAGLNGARFAARAGITIPVRPIRSTVIETEPAEGAGRLAVWSPYVAFRPTPRGSFYLGNGYRGAGGDYDVTLGGLRHLRYYLANYWRNKRRIDLVFGREMLLEIGRGLGWLARGRAIAPALPPPRLNPAKLAYNAAAFRRLMPRFAGLGIQRHWAGRVDLTPDAIPAIGPLRTVPNLFVATGFSGHGFALGPVTGRLLSEWALDGRPSLDLSAFDPHRFVDRKVAAYRDSL